MGNQLSGIAPSQIFPVEHYLTDLPEFQFESSLGSTRFFKVAKANFREGPVVVKVFAIHDPSLPLKGYKEQLDECKNKLEGAPNCLAFQKYLATDKACLLFRQYVRDNLYDRISTRPFLNAIEKKWLAFQILSALSQCHRVGVSCQRKYEFYPIDICHGDIKLENIMVTGWNWILLTDFATFKPTYLPEDNPADFSYFFDTSRRRTCYIAPERFVRTLNTELGGASTNASPHLVLPDDDDFRKGELTPAMDIFSTGCALVELFTEGHAPFHFSQLLSYRNGDYDHAAILDTIEDTDIKNLVCHMIQKDPIKRFSADKYLENERGRAFPIYFYQFLDKYVEGFSTTPIMFADEKISRLLKAFINVWASHERLIDSKQEIMSALRKKLSGADSVTSLNNIEGNGSDVLHLYGLEIIITLLTSCSRAVKHCKGKLQSLEFMLELSPHLSHEVILDRLLPYMLFLINDQSPQVRVAALETITKCLQFVKEVPRSDANIFPDYILPHLAPKAHDDAVIVRVAFAKNIAILADTALNYLEMSQLNTSYSEDDENNAHYQANYDSELRVLQEIVQQVVSTMLLDADNIVKHTLLEFGITRLCVFFGRQKANDLLLSHMITVLNDKDDRHLRGAFFDTIVGVAAYVGWHCSPILKPLLLQGLNDTDEFVTHKALMAMANLTELGLFQKYILYDLLAGAAPFLCHPNLWIRHGAVGFVCSAARTLNVADILSKLLPMLQSFIKYPIIQLDKEVVLLGVLNEPIPRAILDTILRTPQVAELLFKLQNRQTMRKRNYDPNFARSDEADQVSVGVIYKRLVSDGMNNTMEDTIIAMKENILKVHKARKRQETKSLSSFDQDGRVSLVKFPRVPRRHAVVNDTDTKFDISTHGKKNKKPVNISFDATNPVVQNMNKEWLHMFGSTDQSGNSSKQINQSSQSSVVPTATNTLSSQHSLSSQTTNPISSDSEGSARSGASQLPVEMAPRPSPKRTNLNPEKLNVLPIDVGTTKTYSTECYAELQDLLERKAQEHMVNTVMRRTVQTASSDLKQPPNSWKPKGILLAHLHEHKAAVNRVLVVPNTTLFTTCSSDGTVKIWDCDKMEKKSICNRSRQTYSRQGDQIVSLAVCRDLQLACASDNGSIHVFEIESGPTKMTTRYTRNLDAQEEGCVADMQFFDTGSQSILAYATLYGSIVGWDLRSPGTAWKLENDCKHGLITSFCVDSRQCWLAVGTSNGSHVCWDLRFQLPISTVTHPTNARVRRLQIHPTQQSWVISAVQGNNEISMWDMETGSRQTTLWASAAPPLSVTHASNDSAHSFCVVNRDGAMPALISGGSDARIRFYDLNKPEDSYIVAEAANDVVSSSVVSYKHQLIDGTEVIKEVYGKGRPGSEDVPRRGPDTPPSGHHDCISDLTVYQTTQWLLVTASRDGLVKVWK